MNKQANEYGKMLVHSGKEKKSENKSCRVGKPHRQMRLTAMEQNVTKRFVLHAA